MQIRVIVREDSHAILHSRSNRLQKPADPMQHCGIGPHDVDAHIAAKPLNNQWRRDRLAEGNFDWGAIGQLRHEFPLRGREWVF